MFKCFIILKNGLGLYRQVRLNLFYTFFNSGIRTTNQYHGRMSTEWNLPEDLSLYMVLQKRILEITLSSWQIKSPRRSKGKHFSFWLMVGYFSSQILVLYKLFIALSSTVLRQLLCVFFIDHPRILEKEVPMDRDVHMHGSSPTLRCTASGGSSPVTIQWQWMPREDCQIRFQ